MFNQMLVKTVVILSVLLTMGACSPLSVNFKAINQSGVYNLKKPAQNVFSSGQPTKEEFAILAKSGIKHIINLRPVQEQKWDEEKHVKSLGMQYHSIPVAGAKGISVENATLLSEKLNTLNNEPTLVHCGSGNRVGALIAVNEAASNNSDIDTAIEQGKLWGLTKLEPIVREKLQNL